MNLERVHYRCTKLLRQFLSPDGLGDAAAVGEPPCELAHAASSYYVAETGCFCETTETSQRHVGRFVGVVVDVEVIVVGRFTGSGARSSRCRVSDKD